jgi:hypothetical protein
MIYLATVLEKKHTNSTGDFEIFLGPPTGWSIESCKMCLIMYQGFFMASLDDKEKVSKVYFDNKKKGWDLRSFSASKTSRIYNSG